MKIDPSLAVGLICDCTSVIGLVKNALSMCHIIINERAHIGECDVIVYDLKNGHKELSELYELREDNKNLKIVAIAKDYSGDECFAMMSEGLNAYVDRSCDSQQFANIIGSVLMDGIWVDSKTILQALSSNNKVEHIDPSLEILSKKELEISKLIVSGYCNTDIANLLNIAEKSVKNKLTSIYSKLKVANRIELAILIKKATLESI